MVSFKKLCSKKTSALLPFFRSYLLQFTSTRIYFESAANVASPNMFARARLVQVAQLRWKSGNVPNLHLRQLNQHIAEVRELFFLQHCILWQQSIKCIRAEITFYNSWALSGWDSRHRCCRWFARRISTVDDALQDCKDFAAIFVTSAVQCAEAS